MKQQKRQQKVRGGAYLSLTTGEIIQTTGEVGGPPRGARGPFVRMPMGTLAIVGPLLGLAYIIFLPLVGILALLWLIGHHMARVLPALVREAISAITLVWRQSLAYGQRLGRATRH